MSSEALRHQPAVTVSELVPESGVASQALPGLPGPKPCAQGEPLADELIQAPPSRLGVLHQDESHAKEQPPGTSMLLQVVEPSEAARHGLSQTKPPGLSHQGPGGLWADGAAEGGADGAMDRRWLSRGEIGAPWPFQGRGEARRDMAGLSRGEIGASWPFGGCGLSWQMRKIHFRSAGLPAEPPGTQGAQGVRGGPRRSGQRPSGNLWNLWNLQSC